MNSTDLQSTGSKYATKQQARRLRLFDARTSAQAASGLQRLTDAELAALRAQRAAQHEQRTTAEYEARRARIRAEIDRAPSSRPSTLNLQPSTELNNEN